MELHTQSPHSEMHRRTQIPLKNLIYSTFSNVQSIGNRHHHHQLYIKKPFIASYLTSVQFNPPAVELKAPIKRTKLTKKWDKEKLRLYSGKLRDCAENRSINEGKAIHKQIKESGIELDSHLCVSLINFYAKCGCLNIARQVLDEMPQRDVVSWTALISGFSGEGFGTEGIRLFCEMYEEGIRPNEFTFATVLKACCVCLNVEFGKQLHGEVVKFGFLSDGHVGSALVDLYAKCGELEFAEKVCLFLPEQNAVSWNSLLNGFALAGDDQKVLRLFLKMKETEMKYNKYTLCTIIKGCAISKNIKVGEIVHALAILSGCEDEEYVTCSLVDMYSKCGCADDALKVFQRIKSPDVVTWSTIICCLEQQGREEKAAELFFRMLSLGLRPNQFTLTSILSAAKDLGNVRYSQCVHACVLKYGFANETVINNSLLTMYMKNEYIDDGLKIFNTMSNRDIVSWNGLLSGFHDSVSCDGPRIFHEMLVNGFKPNLYTFISTLRSCTSSSNSEFGKQVHAQIIKDNLDNDCYVGTALIDLYVKSKCIEDAEKIFSKMNKVDLFTWTSIISGCAQTDQGEKSIFYFNQMRKDGVKPNEFTLAACLKGCSGITNLTNGRQLHSIAFKDGHVDDPFVASALVDIYGKCGCIDDAETIFHSVESHDTVLWNTIINQYAQHGYEEKSLKAFESMLIKGVLPDEVTFIGILSACSHLGLIELGKKYFYSMTEVYKIVPNIEHYACMVDILGRAGKFSQVENFIDQMKITPNNLIWETLLGACKVHGNVDLGQKVAEKLFQMEHDVNSNYIMLSNIFASKGMWDDVARVRGLMSSQGIKKEPGCSWVEADGQTHVFLSQDTSHQRILEIHQKLRDLEQMVFSVGYLPNTDYVLHNVSVNEKREILSHHSERLALAFSLIENKTNKTIRIFKNLKICGDCHEYMKLVSSIMNKKIVIRDAKLFHHFEDGACSCKDYW
ncbi:pentatricopeptide repeat-containing protein At2g03880, mitochondrial-like [Rutidosis leptorrhynchoides]|uniref:pentatricopeptide repeat-containing protein At2g03880, mitochondrial-like n=1 Tax=Rutidosis leptorrhynchoides TaxID=125765 RepID=UPI003A99908A